MNFPTIVSIGLLSSCASNMPYKQGEPEGYDFYHCVLKTDSTLQCYSEAKYPFESIEIHGEKYSLPFSEPRFGDHCSVDARAWHGSDYAYFLFIYNEKITGERKQAFVQLRYSDEQATLIGEPLSENFVLFKKGTGSIPVLKPISSGIVGKKDIQYTLFNGSIVEEENEILYSVKDGYAFLSDHVYFKNAFDGSVVELGDDLTFLVSPDSDDCYFKNNAGEMYRYDTQSKRALKDVIGSSNRIFATSEASILADSSNIRNFEESAFLYQKENGEYIFSSPSSDIAFNVNLPFSSIGEVKEFHHFWNTPIYNVVTDNKVYTIDVNTKTINDGAFEINDRTMHLKNIEFEIYKDDRYTFFARVVYDPDYFARSHSGYLCRQENDSSSKLWIGKAVVHPDNLCLGIERIIPR